MTSSQGRLWVCTPVTLLDDSFLTYNTVNKYYLHQFSGDTYFHKQWFCTCDGRVGEKTGRQTGGVLVDHCEEISLK